MAPPNPNPTVWFSERSDWCAPNVGSAPLMHQFVSNKNFPSLLSCLRPLCVFPLTHFQSRDEPIKDQATQGLWYYRVPAPERPLCVGTTTSFHASFELHQLDRRFTSSVTLPATGELFHPLPASKRPKLCRSPRLVHRGGGRRGQRVRSSAKEASLVPGSEPEVRRTARTTALSPVMEWSLVRTKGHRRFSSRELGPRVWLLRQRGIPCRNSAAHTEAMNRPLHGRFLVLRVRSGFCVLRFLLARPRDPSQRPAQSTTGCDA